MKTIIALSVLFAFTVMHIDAYSGRPFVVQFQDQGDEDHHMMEEPRFHTLYENQHSNDESLESKENSHGNAYLHEYSRRVGPHESSDSVQDMYNISEEYEKDSEDQHQEETYHHESSEEQQNSKVYTKHIYAHDYSDSTSHSSESKLESKKHNVVTKKEDCSSSEERSEEHEPEPEHHSCNKPKCEKCEKNKKMVYVYKQQPIVIRPKPTNVYIKSKPIVVQPPPLVVHQPAQKPCNPTIQYKPPNIRVQPVIVKIKKPKTTTTTTTTHRPTTTCKPKTTTRKSCRKCRRKPTRKCNRCQKKKSRDYKVYYNGESIMT